MNKYVIKLIFNTVQILMLNVMSADVPSPPVGPLAISNVTDSSADLEWKPSEDDGGSPILHYAIEIRESRRSIWGRAGVVDANTLTFTAKNLVVNNEYFFRVRAVNSEGESLPLEGVDSVTPSKKKGRLNT